MKPEVLRAWWFQRQGLDHPSKLSAADVLEKTGWPRSVGGANPYLAIWARNRSSRESIDKALENESIHELPSARGCTYIVPKNHYALALKIGQPKGDAPDVAGAKKFLGVTEKEIEKLETKILEALKKSAMDPREIKEVVGDAARSLGEAGKKRGTTTTLPLALGRLQSNGRIRRISNDGRIDNQRYKYAAWNPSPLANYKLSAEEAHVELAKLYFKWIGPASLANFQWFSGLGVAAAKSVLAPLKLQPLEDGSDLLLLTSDRDSLHSFKPPKEEQIALVGCLDNIVHLSRDLSAHLDEKDKNQKIRGEKGMQTFGSVQDLNSHGIFDRGRIIGIWEYDVEKEEIVWKTFTRPSIGVKKAVAEMEAFVRDQLGDARSFSLDSPASRKPRLDAIRNA
jgi:hypothetical protein